MNTVKLEIRTFLNKENITNLIKENTSFKGVGSFFDLILTIFKYSFQYSTSIVIDLSDHHHLIFSMMKGKLAVEEPKRLLYHNFNCFKDDYFEKGYHQSSILTTRATRFLRIILLMLLIKIHLKRQKVPV